MRLNAFYFELWHSVVLKSHSWFTISFVFLFFSYTYIFVLVLFSIFYTISKLWLLENGVHF